VTRRQPPWNVTGRTTPERMRSAWLDYFEARTLTRAELLERYGRIAAAWCALWPQFDTDTDADIANTDLPLPFRKDDTE